MDTAKCNRRARNGSHGSSDGDQTRSIKAAKRGLGNSSEAIQAFEDIFHDAGVGDIEIGRANTMLRAAEAALKTRLIELAVGGEFQINRSQEKLPDPIAEERKLLLARLAELEGK